MNGGRRKKKEETRQKREDRILKREDRREIIDKIREKRGESRLLIEEIR